MGLDAASPLPQPRVTVDKAPVLLDRLSRDELTRLLPLTNDDRYDRYDDGGSGGGSSFRTTLHNALRGEEHPTMYVVRAFCAGRLVGWSLFRVDEGVAATAGFYVDPLQRRMGIGRALFRRVAALSQHRFGCERVYVQPWNRPGRSFFAAQGAAPSPDGLLEVVLR